jgi:Na+/pantothenate symporter
MRHEDVQDSGFTAPASRALGQERRTVAVAALIASVTLALSTIVAVTVVTVGIARAGAVDSVIDNEGGLFAIALLLGLVFIGVGGFSMLPHRDRHRHRH